MNYHHIALSVKDLERSSKFYKEVFGFIEVSRSMREDLGIKIIVLKINQEDNLHLELIKADKPKNNKDNHSDLSILGLKHICFEIKNADEKYVELKNKGYEITLPQKGRSVKKYFFIKDPDGFTMEFCEKY